MPDRPGYAPRALYWALPALFALHDAEELLTMPAWMVAHETTVRRAFTALHLSTADVPLPQTTASVAVAITVVGVVFAGAAAALAAKPTSPTFRAVYGGLLGAFFLHAFTHLAQGVWFRGYTPGIITAAVVVAPGAAWLHHALEKRGALDRHRTRIATVVAMLLFVPATLLAFSVAHMFTGPRS